MKKVFLALFAICGFSFAFVSCKLSTVDPNATAAVSNAADAAVADFTALATADTIKKDKGPKHGHDKPDSTKKIQLTQIDLAALPNAITTYISTNYVGSTINKAAQNADKTKYFVSITKADGTKALLEFDSAGAFVNERTHKEHLKGTKIEVSALPAIITAYIAKNYAGSTTKRAIQTTAGYLVDIVKADTTVVGLLFNTDGTFVKEVAIKPKK
jgi:Putative beta-lactamase-inhibitor-like, PepSY-like